MIKHESKNNLLSQAKLSAYKLTIKKACRLRGDDMMALPLLFMSKEYKSIYDCNHILSINYNTRDALIIIISDTGINELTIGMPFEVICSLRI